MMIDEIRGDANLKVRCSIWRHMCCYSQIALDPSRYCGLDLMSKYLQTPFIVLLAGADEAVREEFVLENLDILTVDATNMMSDDINKIKLRYQNSIVQLCNAQWPYSR